MSCSYAFYSFIQNTGTALYTKTWKFSVDGEGIILQFVAELGLEITELLLEDVGAHEDDVLGLEAAHGLHHEEELVGLASVVVGGLIKTF